MTVAARDAVVDTTPALRIDWTWLRFDALSGADVYAMLALRSAVFVVEQTCVFLDADGVDAASWHLLGRAADGALACYLRAIDPGIKYDEPSIGRVVTAPAWRRGGLGHALLAEGIARSRTLWPDRDIVIGAQRYLERFYRGYGFVREGEVYDEDGIDHIRMRLRAR